MVRNAAPDLERGAASLFHYRSGTIHIFCALSELVIEGALQH